MRKEWMNSYQKTAGSVILRRKQAAMNKSYGVPTNPAVNPTGRQKVVFNNDNEYTFPQSVVNQTQQQALVRARRANGVPTAAINRNHCHRV